MKLEPGVPATDLQLLPRSALIATGEVDHADWNYRPILGWIQRLRFRWVESELEGLNFDRLLEIGYGSGVLMPLLAQHCEELHGIDIHRQHELVGRILASHGIRARLRSASVSHMPLPDKSLGCIVCVSALEFVDDLEAACVEMKRVLRADGLVLVVVPGHSGLLDLGLRVLTGQSATRDFADRRQKVIPTLTRHFKLEKRSTVPWTGGITSGLYTGLRLTSERL